MIRGTTPSIQLTITGADLSSATATYVTLKQGNVTITKTDGVYDDGVLTIELTEAESLAFDTGSAVMCQVNWLYLDNGETKRAATTIQRIPVLGNLLTEVLISD